MAQWAVRFRSISIRLSCRTFSISETCYRYQPKLGDENQQIADHLLALTKAKKMWGFGLCYLYLRNVKGFGWNITRQAYAKHRREGHKRVYRIYRELELNMRIKPRKRLQRDRPEPLAVPDAPNEVWSMDFMADQLADGRSFRTLNLLDHCMAGFCEANAENGLQPRRSGHRGGLLTTCRTRRQDPKPDH